MDSILIMILSILLSLVSVKVLINILIKLKFGQPIREEGNKEHYKKAGTPTMGGIAFIIVFTILSMIFVKFDASLVFILLSTLSFGAIGLLDDLKKIAKKQNMGLTERQKLILQFATSFVLITVFYFLLKEDIGILETPLFKLRISLGVFAIPILMFIMVGSVNAVNFTDGLDGLLSSVSIPIFLGIHFIALLDNPSVAMTSLIFAGALIGFLWFNSYPASIFMGDVGSMAIGGAIVAMLITLNKPLYYAIIGGVYLVEALSVVIQRVYFRKTGGKRIFLMSPIHHHYELKGYKETKIVSAFMIVSILLTLITIYII